MTPTITLVSIACAIANGGAIDTSTLTAQLNEGDQFKVEQIAVSGACLPENMEKLLRDTVQGLANGETARPSAPMPTDGCY